MAESNEYLAQVVQAQQNVGRELQHGLLKVAAAEAPPARSAGGILRFKKGIRGAEEGSDLAEGPSVAAVDYRITGFWRWKTVVVPPNVYVVHTRRGHAEPLHVGLGISFHYNPATDSFLVIPAAVQTLLISAKCICAERQGLLVQAYVQWVVDDVRTAYRKLDFSDASDPMRIVNVQLREQAEAAIKDKVAMMSIDAVLSDKQPIIEELTTRLRAVAEGSREATGYTGLGLKIVTVQIKEAVVSSTRLWENLQKPFRAEREKLARMAELDAQQQIARQELTNRQARETADLENARLLAQIRATQEREVYDRNQAEQARRLEVEQAAEQQAVVQRTATEKARKEADLELALQQMELEARRLAQELESVRRQMELEKSRLDLEKARASAAAEVENLVHQARSTREERDLVLFKQRRTAENDLSEQHVTARLIDRLPEIANALPQPQELRTVSIASDQGGGASSLVGFLASVLQLANGALKRPAGSNDTASS